MKLAYFYCNRGTSQRAPDHLEHIQQFVQTESENNKLLKLVIDIYLDQEKKVAPSIRALSVANLFA